MNDPQKPLSVLPVAERERIWVRLSDSVEAVLLNRSTEDAWVVVNEKEVRFALNELVNSPDGFVIVSSGDHYVQFKIDSDRLHMEAVSNQYLPEKLRLDEAKQSLILELGFHAPGSEESPNYARSSSVVHAKRDLDSLAALAVKVMTDIYEVSRAKKLAVDIHIGE